MTEMTYAQALALGLTECLDQDPRVVLINASFGGLTPHRNSYAVLRQKYADRITDAPISELGYCGIAIGAAMTGLRPVVEFMSFNFSFVGADQIISNAAKMYYMSGNRFNVPVVFRGPNGAAAQVSSQHSHCVEAIYGNLPGLIIIAPLFLWMIYLRFIFGRWSAEEASFTWPLIWVSPRTIESSPAATEKRCSTEAGWRLV